MASRSAFGRYVDWWLRGFVRRRHDSRQPRAHSLFDAVSATLQLLNRTSTVVTEDAETAAHRRDAAVAIDLEETAAADESQKRSKAATASLRRASRSRRGMAASCSVPRALDPGNLLNRGAVWRALRAVGGLG